MLNHVRYIGAQQAKITMVVKPPRSAPEGDYPTPDGIVVRSGRSGVVCSWGVIALHLEEALVLSPMLRADVEAALARAKTRIEEAEDPPLLPYGFGV